MKKQQGFTLIELVIVIVILGILAVTAAPRFINLSSDARASTVEGLQAGVIGGANLVYSKAAINGVENADSETDVNVGPGDVSTIFGYPSESDFAADAGNWLDIPATDWTVDDSESPVTISPAGYTAPDGEACELRYTEADSAGARPTIAIETGGC